MLDWRCCVGFGGETVVGEAVAAGGSSSGREGDLVGCQGSAAAAAVGVPGGCVIGVDRCLVAIEVDSAGLGVAGGAAVLAAVPWGI